MQFNLIITMWFIVCAIASAQIGGGTQVAVMPLEASGIVPSAIEEFSDYTIDNSMMVDEGNLAEELSGLSNTSSKIESSSSKTRTKAVLRSIFIPGWGQAYGGKSVRAVLYSYLQAAALAGVYWSINNYNSKIDAYKESQSAYRASIAELDLIQNRSRMLSDYDAVTRAEKMRNQMIGLAAGVWLWNVLDAIIWPPEKAPKVGIRAKPQVNFYSDQQQHTAKIGLSWRW